LVADDEAGHRKGDGGGREEELVVEQNAECLKIDELNSFH